MSVDITTGRLLEKKETYAWRTHCGDAPIVLATQRKLVVLLLFVTADV